VSPDILNLIVYIMSILISILAFFVSLGALFHTISSGMRNNNRIKREKKDNTLQYCIDLRITYGVVLSDVLTRNIDDYREEVKVIIVEFRKKLPNMIERVESLEANLHSIPYNREVEIEGIATTIIELKTSLQGLIDMLNHGFIRGRQLES